MGHGLFDSLKTMLRQDDDPNLDGAHLGSAYNGGWYHYAQKDLRRLLGRKRLRGLRGPPARGNRFSRAYCGGTQPPQRKPAPLPRRGSRRRSRSALRVDPKKLYEDEVCEDYERPSDQWCYDAVRQRPVGAVNQPLIHWINRPTFQQAVEIQRAVPR